jgi:hypothetical protein
MKAHHQPTSSLHSQFPFWAIFLLVVSLYFFGWSYWFFHFSASSASWPHTEGVIQSVTIQREVSRHGVSFEAFINYQYNVAEQTFTAQDGPYKLDVFSGDATEASRQANARFTTGKTLLVSYDPDHHDRSTLQAGQPQRAYQNLFTGFVCVALAAWVFWKTKRKREA